jgi:hypothetical protein
LIAPGEESSKEITKHKTKNMKHILLLISVVTLVGTTGCIFPGHRGGGDYGGHEDHHGHGEYEGHSEYNHAPEPVVVVRVHPD